MRKNNDTIEKTILEKRISIYMNGTIIKQEVILFA